MNKTLKRIAGIILPLLVLTGCDNSDEPNTDTTIFAVFATLDSVNDKGSVFTTREKDDSPVVTLTTNKKVDTATLPVGDRCIISYSNSSDKPFVSGSINLIQIQLVANGDVQTATAAEIRQLTTDVIRVKSIGRTGTYINVQCEAPMSSQAKSFNLYVDQESLSTETPQVYLGFKSDMPNAMNDKEFYGSFDIASLMNDPSYKQISIHYTDETGPSILTVGDGAVSITPVQP